MSSANYSTHSGLTGKETPTEHTSTPLKSICKPEYMPETKVERWGWAIPPSSAINAALNLAQKTRRNGFEP